MLPDYSVRPRPRKDRVSMNSQPFVLRRGFSTIHPICGRNLILVISILITVLGCQKPLEKRAEPESPTAWALLCRTPASDGITNSHVLNVLRLNGIPYSFDSSIWANIYVSPIHIERAEQLLRSSSSNTNILLDIYNDEESGRPCIEVYAAEVDRFETALPVTPTSDHGLDFQRIVQTIRTQVPDSILYLHPQYDQGRLLASKRTYLGYDGEETDGMDVTIELSKQEAEGKYLWQQSFSIWNNWESTTSSAITNQHRRK